jgi:hypothetical protein
MGFQEEFKGLIAAADECCARRFGARLMAAYIAGSVAFDEALPGASDLDWFMFLRDEPSTADKSWRYRAQKRLEIRFPAAAEVHLNLFSVHWLKREKFSRFILRYNAVKVRGRDLVAELEHSGFRTPRPSRGLAKSRLPFVRKCLKEALAGRRPPSLAELPEDPFLTTRKLARNFVIVEGAYALMSAGAFKSFRQEAVFCGLRRISRRWGSLIDTTQAILEDPRRAAVRPAEFMREVNPFMDWAIDLIEDAQRG